MDATATSGLTAQFQAAATKTALNVQKQEGENAISLIKSAAEEDTEASSSGNAPQPTGNNVDTLV